jgi:hypothetical protein
VSFAQCIFLGGHALCYFSDHLFFCSQKLTMAPRAMMLEGILAKIDESPKQRRLSRGLLEELVETPKRRRLQRRWLRSIQLRLLSKLRSLTNQRCEHVDVRV